MKSFAIEIICVLRRIVNVFLMKKGKKVADFCFLCFMGGCETMV